MLVLTNENDETLAELAEGYISIGRGRENDVVLADSSVSRFHAEIVVERGVVWVEDLNSTNGSAIDGQRLHERAQLRAWNHLQLGRVQLEIAEVENRRPPRGPRQGSVRPVSAEPANGGAHDNQWACFGGYPRGLAWLLFSFRGRISRGLWWKSFGVFILASVAITVLAMLLVLSPVLLGDDPFMSTGAGGTAIQVAYLLGMSCAGAVTMWSWLAITAKRIHDSNCKAWFWCVIWGLNSGVLTPAVNWVNSFGGIGAQRTLGALSLVLAIPAF